MYQTRAFSYAAGAGTIGVALATLVFFLTLSIGAAGGLVVLAATAVATAALGYFLGARFDRIERKRSELSRSMEDAERHLGQVAKAAVSGEGWEIGLRDERIPTCWEILDCTSPECPVYGKRNIRCWFIAGTYCSGEVQGTFAQKLNNCSECRVYQLAVGDNPVDQIHESFNNLLWVINEKAKLLSSTNLELKDKYDELEALHVEARRMAETDSLTGLYNYAHFNEHLKRELVETKRYGKVLSLLMLDFDNFKQVNEKYGYRQGDMVLKSLADHLKVAAGSEYYIARYGNEEFMVVMAGVGGEEATEFARGVVKSFREAAAGADVAGEELNLSIGVADYPDCAGDAQSLVSAADAALFFAKNKVGDGVAYFCDLSGMELEAGDIQRLQNRLHGAGIATLTALARAVDATDLYGVDGRERLGRLAQGMARDLGMDDEEAELLVLASSIHDIGKIGVPAEVLTKTDKLTEIEVEMIRRHPEIGQEILREARQIQELVLAILYHHERWDGQGYPEGLEGNRIPRLARIVGIFDAYRAMRSDRPYRKALSRERAVAELRKGAGSQFDPEMVELFVARLQGDSAENLKEAS